MLENVGKYLQPISHRDILQIWKEFAVEKCCICRTPRGLLCSRLAVLYHWLVQIVTLYRWLYHCFTTGRFIETPQRVLSSTLPALYHWLVPIVTSSTVTLVGSLYHCFNCTTDLIYHWLVQIVTPQRAETEGCTHG